MPPRLPVRSLTGCGRALDRLAAEPFSPSICLLCSLSYGTAPAAHRRTKRTKLDWTRRAVSTAPVTDAATSPRKELAERLLELEKRAGDHVDLSRIQLALRGLEQQPGNETVRVAILGLNHGPESPRITKELVRLLLADPLKADEGWEEQLDNHDMGRPLLIHVGRAPPQQQDEARLVMANEEDGSLKEIRISSPTLNGHNLELLLMEATSIPGTEEDAVQSFEEAILVPAVDIPISDNGRFTPVTTPVHRALLLGDGIIGAASVLSMPPVLDKDVITAAVNLTRYAPDETANCPFVGMDIKTASRGLALVRQDIAKAMEFERMWYTSNVPAVLDWLKLGTQPSADGATKPPVRKLVDSVLKDALASVQNEELARLSSASFQTPDTSTAVALNQSLSEWAERAHTELQEQLDAAFTSRRWRKLGWWKLFWRVDDVGMLSSEMLSARFLPGAERDIIFLAGRIEEACLAVGHSGYPIYSTPSTAPTPERDETKEVSLDASAAIVEPQAKWPTHISFTRNYLQERTVPALQALAQRLVIQTASTSAVTTSLAGLMYTSSFGLSEAGAVAALGIVWSLRRLQKKWETAREFWEGEVREEGRKAVRAVEMSVDEVLDHPKEASEDGPSVEDLDRIKELVQKAEDALAKLK